MWAIAGCMFCSARRPKDHQNCSVPPNKMPLSPLWNDMKRFENISYTERPYTSWAQYLFSATLVHLCDLLHLAFALPEHVALPLARPGGAGGYDVAVVSMPHVRPTRPPSNLDDSYKFCRLGTDLPFSKFWMVNHQNAGGSTIWPKMNTPPPSPDIFRRSNLGSEQLNHATSSCNFTITPSVLFKFILKYQVQPKRNL